MKTIIHINQHKIRAGESRPITVKTYKSNRYCREFIIKGPVKVVYSPDKPLSCGAKCWVVTNHDVELIDEETG